MWNILGKNAFSFENVCQCFCLESDINPLKGILEFIAPQSVDTKNTSTTQYNVEVPKGCFAVTL